MNYLTDWTDISKISVTGWSGSPSFDINNNCLLFTATNGWRSFFWNIPDIINQPITLEFDYKFTNIDNYSDCWVINNNSYGGITNGGITKTTEWSHCKKEFTPTTQYIGINVRGVDNTGKSVIMALKNIQLLLNANSNHLYQSGNFITQEVLENNKIGINKNYVSCNEIIEI